MALTLQTDAGALPAQTDLDLNEPRLVGETGLALRVADLLAPTLVHLDFRVVRVKISAAAGCTIQIMAEDAKGQMTIEDCERIHDAVSPILDLNDPMSQAYRLEISSPGIDRPLVRVSDFDRALGHEARVEVKSAVEGRRRFKGIIKSVDAGARGPVLLLERLDAKAEEAALVALELNDLAEARLVLTDDLIRASLRAAKAAVKGKPAGGERAPAKAMTKAARLKNNALATKLARQK